MANPSHPIGTVINNRDLRDRHEAAISRGVSTGLPAYVARARNAEVWDVEGRRYIDFASGIAVLNTGHCHPHVMAAVTAQLEAFTHCAFQVMGYEPYVALAERLNALAPFAGPAKTIFFTTGAEAVENAIKIARAATGRSGVIAFAGGFHGRTMMTMALTGKIVPYKRRFGPMPGGVHHLPFPLPHYGVSVEDVARALDQLFRADIEPSEIAAIIIEPVQGEGGFHEAPPELMRMLRATCDTHGIVLIADEVQSGFGRSGKMFAIERSGVEPDLVTVAKSIAGGLPLSGVIGRAALMDAADPGGLGGTFAGPPLSCAAGLAVLDVIERESLLSRAVEIGDNLRRRLSAIAERSDAVPIANIRGPGAMVAFDVVMDRGSNSPAGAQAKALTLRALDHGLILLSCGIYGETIRLLPPLTASDALIDEGLEMLAEALCSGEPTA